MENKYLPIGSVCTLKDRSKKVMIIGYCYNNLKSNLVMKDYLGCAYPEGLLLPEYNCSFNHDEINSIDFVGYKDDTFNVLLANLPGNEQNPQKHDDMFLTSNSDFSKLLFDENGVVMIADPVSKDENLVPKQEEPVKDNSNNNIASNISAETKIEFPEWNFNPFSTPSNEPVKPAATPSTNTTGEYAFDENGVVIAAPSFTEQSKPAEASVKNYKFDENGVVISE